MGKDWDTLFDPPCGHKPECSCSTCHSDHVEDGDLETTKDTCSQCKDLVEMKIADGEWCKIHGALSEDERPCEKCGIRSMNPIVLIFLFIFLSSCATIPYNQKSPILKYNYLEKEYSYEHPESRLKYNYLEKRWEWTK